MEKRSYEQLPEAVRRYVSNDGRLTVQGTTLAITEVDTFQSLGEGGRIRLRDGRGFEIPASEYRHIHEAWTWAKEQASA